MPYGYSVQTQDDLTGKWTELKRFLPEKVAVARRCGFLWLREELVSEYPPWGWEGWKAEDDRLRRLAREFVKRMIPMGVRIQQLEWWYKAEPPRWEVAWGNNIVWLDGNWLHWES